MFSQSRFDGILTGMPAVFVAKRRSGQGGSMLRFSGESFGVLRIPLDRIIPSEVEGQAYQFSLKMVKRELVRGASNHK